jgi:hypothetical protein
MIKGMGLGTLLILGICLADLLTHVQGTEALGSSLVSLEATGSNALLGVSPNNKGSSAN